MITIDPSVASIESTVKEVLTELPKHLRASFCQMIDEIRVDAKSDMLMGLFEYTYRYLLGDPAHDDRLGQHLRLPINDTSVRIEGSDNFSVRLNKTHLKNNTGPHAEFIFSGCILPIMKNLRNIDFNVRISSLICDSVHGGPVAIAIGIREWILIPIFAGEMFSSLVSVVLIRLSAEGPESFKVLSQRNRFASFFSENIFNSIVNASIDSVSRSIPVNHKDLRIAIVAGHRRSFGHTIINDVNSLILVPELIKHRGNVTVLIGKYDYLELDVLLGSMIGQDCIRYIRSTEPDNGVWSFANEVLVPLGCWRPCRDALKMVASTTCNHKIKVQSDLTVSIYLSLDSRSGKRTCINQEQVVDSCLRELDSLSYGQDMLSRPVLIVDGSTAVPHKSSNSSIIKHEIATSISPNMRSLLLRKSLEYNLPVVIIDGLSFRSKMAILGNLTPSLAICPYGSSAMLPIYILNIATHHYGSEALSERLETWAWHITAYCHSERRVLEAFIPSSEVSAQGYIVDVNELCRTIRHSL